MVTIITGTTTKPMVTEQLKKFFSSKPDLSGYLYIGYPIIGTVNGAFRIDALWISEEKGIVVFNLIEAKDLDKYEDYQDDCANKIESKLKGYKELVSKRTLCVEITVITFSPTLKRIPPYDPNYPLCNEESLGAVLDGITWDKPEYYQNLVSVLQAISTIRKGKKRREILNSNSKGARLQSIEDSIANLDNRQSRAVIETVEGVQRIRGLAGSGKTVVLALKAAYLHAQHPNWKIAVTFYTRTLKEQLRQLISTFYIEQTSEEPDWDNIQIIQSWGAPGGGEKNGMYYTFCALNNVSYYDFSSAEGSFGKTDPFGAVCKKAVADAQNIQEIYDAILVDEAQDFSPSFLLLCYEMLKKPKRLVYAYDELQNLRIQSLPAPEEIFGLMPNGKPRVSFMKPEKGRPEQDIILEKCYRNSRPALVTAHALGFGIYRKPKTEDDFGLVQMFDQNSLWQDIGYEIAEGSLNDGQHIILKRTDKGSPEFLESHSETDDLISFICFKTANEQNLWIADQIQKNITKDELRPDDIIVINPNPLTTKTAVAPIRRILFERGIPSHTAGVDCSPDVFFTGGSVTFTGIYRAKGNEAAMVYIVNAQTCFYSQYDIARIRNQLFTAITRSKAWVRVLGIGDEMSQLIAEFEEVKNHDFTLDFNYPTKAQRKHMNIVNRDMTENEKNKVKRTKTNLNDIIDLLESEQLYLEDLGETQIEKLRSLLNGKGE